MKIMFRNWRTVFKAPSYIKHSNIIVYVIEIDDVICISDTLLYVRCHASIIPGTKIKMNS